MKKLFLTMTIGAMLLFTQACNTGSKSGLTPETQKLYTLLQTIPQRGFMFGHQDATVYGVGWVGDENRSDVNSVCGDFPAVMGSEIGHIELGKTVSLDSVPFERIRSHIIAQYQRGGINTLSWHLDNPFNGGSAWDVSSKDSVVLSILAGGKNHAKFLTWLDIVAHFITSLKTPEGVKVPILFRPFHEHSGSWFWWGKDHCTPDQYKQLWIMTHDYLQSKGVNNIIYAYSPGGGISKEEYLERYPGDKYVDLLGFDYYQMGEQGNVDYKKDVENTLSLIEQLGKEHHKPIAITETGFVNIPDSTWWTKTLLPTIGNHPISYVLVWRNAHQDAALCYAPYPGQTSAADFVKFYHNAKTLFCKDINQ